MPRVALNCATNGKACIKLWPNATSLNLPFIRFVLPFAEAVSRLSISDVDVFSRRLVLPGGLKQEAEPGIQAADPAEEGLTDRQALFYRFLGDVSIACTPRRACRHCGISLRWAKEELVWRGQS